ncbi:MAG: prepilin-type N-terminal cleavage/methylation domain-containing protein [Opitutales bacterium]
MCQFSRKASRLRRRQGFSLVEMMVVMGIIIALAALTMGVKQYLDAEAAENTARMEMQVLAAAIEAHKNTYGDYPYGTNERELYEALTGKSRWTPVPGSAPILVEVTELDLQKALIDETQMTVFNGQFTDPWGNAYDYNYRNAPTPGSSSGPGTEQLYSLFSKGPDGQPGSPGSSNQQQKQQAADNIYP